MSGVYLYTLGNFILAKTQLIQGYLARMKEKGKISRNIDPNSAAEVILALAIGLRIKTLYLGRDTNTTKEIWINSVARVLLLESNEEI